MIRDSPDGHGCVASWRFDPGVALAASPERAVPRVVVAPQQHPALSVMAARARRAPTTFDHSGSPPSSAPPGAGAVEVLPSFPSPPRCPDRSDAASHAPLAAMPITTSYRRVGSTVTCMPSSVSLSSSRCYESRIAGTVVHHQGWRARRLGAQVAGMPDPRGRCGHRSAPSAVVDGDDLSAGRAASNELPHGHVVVGVDDDAFRAGWIAQRQKH
jgi:hypothetical protein